MRTHSRKPFLSWIILLCSCLCLVGCAPKKKHKKPGKQTKNCAVKAEECEDAVIRKIKRSVSKLCYEMWGPFQVAFKIPTCIFDIFRIRSLSSSGSNEEFVKCVQECVQEKVIKKIKDLGLELTESKLNVEIVRSISSILTDSLTDILQKTRNFDSLPPNLQELAIRFCVEYMKEAIPVLADKDKKFHIIQFNKKFVEKIMILLKEERENLRKLDSFLRKFKINQDDDSLCIFYRIENEDGTYGWTEICNIYSKLTMIPAGSLIAGDIEVLKDIRPIENSRPKSKKELWDILAQEKILKILIKEELSKILRNEELSEVVFKEELSKVVPKEEILKVLLKKEIWEILRKKEISEIVRQEKIWEVFSHLI